MSGIHWHIMLPLIFYEDIYMKKHVLLSAIM